MPRTEQLLASALLLSDGGGLVGGDAGDEARITVAARKKRNHATVSGSVGRASIVGSACPCDRGAIRRVEGAGLAASPIPDPLAPQLRKQGPWVFTRREVDPMAMYAFSPYIVEAVAESVEDATGAK